MGMMDGEVTTLALCWRLERRDGAGIALTSHGEPLSRDGVRFDAAPGMTPAAVARSVGVEPHAAEASGALSSAALTEKDLALGRWDGAAARLSVADWADAGETPLSLVAGTLGDTNVSGGRFSAELRGAAAALGRSICPATSPECRAELGDRKCRVDLAGRSVRARVMESDGTTLTLDTEVNDRFVLGRIRYLDGENCGIMGVILGAIGNAIHVREPPRGLLLPGAVVELREGCDRRFSTCVSQFGNAANFRGEPHLPGNDLLTRYPGA